MVVEIGWLKKLLGEHELIRVYDALGTDHWSLVEEMDNLHKAGKSFVVEINSFGGDWDVALGITSRILLYGAITWCSGVAFSGAAVLFLAGGLRIAMNYSEIWFHAPRRDTSIQVSMETLEREIASLGETRDTIVRMLAKRTVLDMSAARELVDRDRIMSAEKAYTLGISNVLVEV